jgi:hypothetical protein
MPEHEARLSRGRPPILALHDLRVGPANTDRDGFQEDRAATCVWLGDLFQARALRLARFYGNAFHFGFS